MIDSVEFKELSKRIPNFTKKCNFFESRKIVNVKSNFSESWFQQITLKSNLF